MMPVEQNHYEFLGVEPEVSPEEIARAVAKLREMWAPGSLALYSLVDREEHKALLDRLEEAAVVLGDARARAAYDERHGIGRRLPPPQPKPRPGPAKQLPLPEIVEAVDGAPAWPNASAGPAEAAPVVEPAPVAAEADVGLDFHGPGRGVGPGPGGEERHPAPAGPLGGVGRQAGGEIRADGEDRGDHVGGSDVVLREERRAQLPRRPLDLPRLVACHRGRAPDHSDEHGGGT